jgi:hypothetical protein
VYDSMDCVPKNWLLPHRMGWVHLQLCGRGHLLLLLLQFAGGTVSSPCPCFLCNHHLTEPRLSRAFPCTSWSFQVWPHWGGSSSHHWGHCSWYVAATGILKVLLLFLMSWNLHLYMLWHSFILTMLT